MLAKLETIAALIEARLNSIDGVAEVKSEAAGDPSRFPALNLKDGQLQPDPTTEVGATRYTYTISVEGNVESGSGAAGRAARNALYLSVVQAVLADTDLDGELEEFEEGPTRFGVAMLASQPRLSFVTEFVLKFAADRNDPAS